MNRILPAALLAVTTVFTLAFAQTTNQPTGQGQTNTSNANRSTAAGQRSNVEQELIRLDQEWTAAEVRGDREAVARFLADDYMQTDRYGVVTNKTQALAEIRATPEITDTADDYVVRVYGDTAVMTHRGTVRGRDNGQEVNEQYRSTHTWVRRQGRWQLVSHHGSLISQPTASPSAPAQPQTSPSPATQPQASPSPAA